MPTRDDVNEDIERAVLAAMVDSASIGLDQIDADVGTQGRAWAIRRLGEGRVEEYEEPGFAEYTLTETEMQALARALGEHRMKIRSEGRAAEQAGFRSAGYSLYYLVEQTNTLLRRIRNVKGTGEPLRLSQVDVLNAAVALRTYKPTITTREAAIMSLSDELSARSELILDNEHDAEQLAHAMYGLIPEFSAGGEYSDADADRNESERTRRY